MMKTKQKCDKIIIIINNNTNTIESQHYSADLQILSPSSTQITTEINVNQVLKLSIIITYEVSLTFSTNCK